LLLVAAVARFWAEISGKIPGSRLAGGGAMFLIAPTTLLPPVYMAQNLPKPRNPQSLAMKRLAISRKTIAQ
jgi:hypothetical protein